MSRNPGWLPDTTQEFTHSKCPDPSSSRLFSSYFTSLSVRSPFSRDGTPCRLTRVDSSSNRPVIQPWRRASGGLPRHPSLRSEFRKTPNLGKTPSKRRRETRRWPGVALGIDPKEWNRPSGLARRRTTNLEPVRNRIPLPGIGQGLEPFYSRSPTRVSGSSVPLFLN